MIYWWFQWFHRVRRRKPIISLTAERRLRRASGRYSAVPPRQHDDGDGPDVRLSVPVDIDRWQYGGQELVAEIFQRWKIRRGKTDLWSFIGRWVGTRRVHRHLRRFLTRPPKKSHPGPSYLTQLYAYTIILIIILRYCIIYIIFVYLYINIVSLFLFFMLLYPPGFRSNGRCWFFCQDNSNT